MPLAAFKDLCLDANDPSTVGAFWAAALGLTLQRSHGRNVVLTGDTPAQTIWVNQVPEPKVVKHRVHLDIHCSSVAAIEAMGATVIDGASFRWTVMADPEGGELCAFVRERPPAYRLYEVVVDCVDHEAISRWWADAIGGRRVIDPKGYAYLRDIPNAPFEALTFLPVDEPKQGKNRIHLDLVAEHPELLLDAGATMLRRRDDEIDWDVLADPEGNELCVFPPREG